MEPAPKILYSRAEAAEMLSLSVSSLDVLIATGKLKAIHKGRRVLIQLSEIERTAAKEIPRIWPSRRDSPGAAGRSAATARPRAMSLPKLPEKIYAYWAHEPELRNLGYVEGIVADEKNLAEVKTPGTMSKVGVYQLVVDVITLPPAPIQEEL